MTILELLQKSTEHLKSHGITNPKTSCEILLAHALGVKRLDLYLNYDKPVTDEERSKFKELYRRRLSHEPIQYILGTTEFMSLPFIVNPDVLVPRPETELLVEKIIEICKAKWNDDEITILDIGTGCGNIAVSLAHFLPNAAVEGVDISPDAVEVAMKNAEMNDNVKNLKLFVKDVFRCGENDYSELKVIVSNPPYVSQDQKEMLDKEVVEYEPSIAVFTGDDNLEYYRKIAALGYSWLSGDGLLFFEIGYDIGDNVKKLLEESGYNNVKVIKDYARHDRIVIAGK
ncbi:MAG: peptide chain release factor N(5)-glutamine methyltransferase [bacterium]|nr:peptide chain release factor N(5)-glutamine methyltransferase [bacterium]